MSFTDPLSIFLPLPESSSMVQRSLSTSSKRPKSYQHPPLSRRDSVTSRRGSVSSQQGLPDFIPIRTSIENPPSSFEISSNENDDDVPIPIRSPPPAYGHDDSVGHHGRSRPPPAYWNRASGPRRSSSCSARFSSDGIPQRSMTYRRISSVPVPPASQARQSHRHSITISPIEQSPSDPPNYVSPVDQHPPSSNARRERRRSSLNTSAGSASASSNTTSTAISSTTLPAPQREPPSPPSSTFTVTSSSSTLVTTPPGPRPTLQIPQAIPLRYSESSSESDGESNLTLQENLDVGEEGKRELQMEAGGERGNWCCGCFWVGSVNDQTMGMDERERERRERDREVSGGKYLGSSAF